MSTAITNSTRTETTEQPERAAREESLSRSEIFEILSNDRRQYVIKFLLEQPEEYSAPLGEVVDYVAERENGVSNAELDTAQRKRVYTALRQCHLPKLDDYGVVTYDNLRSEVQIGSDIDDIQQYLDYDPGSAGPWSNCYLGLSVITVVAALLSLVGAFPFGSVPDELLMLAIMVSFGVIAGAHTYQLAHVTLPDYRPRHWGIDKLRFS